MHLLVRKLLHFNSKFHWNLIERVLLTIRISDGSDNGLGLALNKQQTMVYEPMITQFINTLRPRQDTCRRHFADDIFTCIFFNENCCILTEFLLKYVRKGPIDNNPALVQIMAWRRSGDKPLSEPMIVSLPTYICVTRPQWVNTYMRQSASLS